MEHRPLSIRQLLRRYGASETSGHSRAVFQVPQSDLRLRIIRNCGRNPLREATRAAAVFVVLIPIQIWRAGKESKVLEEKFGDEYRKYRAQTWF